MSIFIKIIRDKYPDCNLRVLKAHLNSADTKVTDFILTLATMHLDCPEWTNNELILTQLQAASLVAKSMCCMLGTPYDCISLYNRLYDPRMPTGADPQTFYANLLTSVDPDDTNLLLGEKLKILYCYFSQCMAIGIEGLTGTIVTRVSSNTLDLKSLENKPMVQTKIVDNYMNVQDPIKVDFANKNIGGGILSHGCCQEEIMFCQHPELIALMSLTNTLTHHEALVVTGVTRYCETRGYGVDMYFSGPATDDSIGSPPLTIIMMDAIDYRGAWERRYDQYKSINKCSELQKAINAFSMVGPGVTITTGDWGCGAFNGDVCLKYLIQWAAATIAGNELYYHAQKTDKVRKLHKAYEAKGLSAVLECILSDEDWRTCDYVSKKY